MENGDIGGGGKHSHERGPLTQQVLVEAGVGAQET